MKKLFFLFTGLSLLLSCADMQRDQFLKQLNKLDKQLLQIESKLEEEQIKDISSIKSKTMQTELRIKQNLHLDTINMALAKQLDAYKVMRRSVKPLMQQYMKARNGVQEEKKVLKQLKRDIQEGRGERHRYAEYIRFERQKVKQLNLLCDDFLRQKDKFFEDYARLYPPVEAFSQTLLHKNQQR